MNLDKLRLSFVNCNGGDEATQWSENRAWTLRAA